MVSIDFLLHPSSFPLLPSPGLELGTRRSKRRVISSFTTRAHRGRGGARCPCFADATKQKTPGPCRAPGFNAERKSAEPRHPVASRRSLRRAQRSSREVALVSDRRDSARSDAPRELRDAREAAADCRDRVNMASRTVSSTPSNESYNMYRRSGGCQFISSLFSNERERAFVPEFYKSSRRTIFTCGPAVGISNRSETTRQPSDS